MCGIAGLFSLNNNPIDVSKLDPMIQSLYHRGPDEEGRFVSSLIAMGIRRLRVVDLVSGSQPITNETNDVTTVFNGEIYNYKELRADLIGKGHTFKTQSDTETIVHLYEEYGELFPGKINGMFAIALWDHKNEKLLLVRDRAGIKPLFYSQVGNELLFGSEIKSILTHPRSSKEINIEAFFDYLSFYYISAPKTIYQNIHRLPAGTVLIAHQGKINLKEYWDWEFKPEDRSLSEFKAEFCDVLERSVKRHLQSDVPVGIYLSGGLDSASLVAMASRFTSSINTYTIGYEEESYSELREARSTANLFKTNHHEYTMRAKDMEDYLPKVIRHFDEPNGDWSSVPHYILAERSKNDVTVALNGAGGDELFGGYPTLVASQAAHYYKRIPSFIRRGAIEPLVRALPSSSKRMSFDFLAKSFVRGANAPTEEAHRLFKEIFSASERKSLLRMHSDSAENNPGNVFNQYKLRFQSLSTMNRLLYLDFKVFMANCPLFVSDMTTAAHGVEGRVPFLDLEMLDFSSRLPWKWKLNGLTTKYIMREALKPLLPPSIIKMKKKGFLIPGAVWLRKELKPLVLDIVGDAEKELAWLFDFPYIKTVLEDHFSGRADNTRRITCLVSFFIWHAAEKPIWSFKNAQ